MWRDVKTHRLHILIVVCSIHRYRVLPKLELLIQKMSQKSKTIPISHLGVGVVGVPGCPQRVLPSQVPHDEVDVLPNHLVGKKIV